MKWHQADSQTDHDDGVCTKIARGRIRPSAWENLKDWAVLAPTTTFPTLPLTSVVRTLEQWLLFSQSIYTPCFTCVSVYGFYVYRSRLAPPSTCVYTCVRVYAWAVPATAAAAITSYHSQSQLAPKLSLRCTHHDCWCKQGIFLHCEFIPKS